MNKVLVFYSTGPEIKHHNKTIDDGVSATLNRLGQGWRVTQASSSGVVAEDYASLGTVTKKPMLTIITTVVLGE